MFFGFVFDLDEPGIIGLGFRNLKVLSFFEFLGVGSPSVTAG